jgi:hypothetical protein
VQRCRWPSRSFLATCLALASLSPIVGSAAGLAAQPVAAYHETDPRAATYAEVVAGNALVGGVLAGLQAAIRGNDPFRAFGIGAIGGLVHLAGKNLALEGGAARAWTGLAISHFGTSVIANAGQGRASFSQIVLPVGPFRVRFAPRDTTRLRADVNVFESVMFLRVAVRNGVRLDWTRSLETGGIAFETERMALFTDQELNGLAISPYYVISDFAADKDAVARHEVVHLHQQVLMEETLGRPVELFLRSRVPHARRIPRWLELGVVSPALKVVEEWATNGRGLSQFGESEAYLLMRR